MFQLSETLHCVCVCARACACYSVHFRKRIDLRHQYAIFYPKMKARASVVAPGCGENKATLIPGREPQADLLPASFL